MSEEIENQDNTPDEIEPTQESTPTLVNNEKIKKHLAAKALVDEAHELIDSTDKQHQECKLLLENDLISYEDAKKTLRHNALDDAKALLVETGYCSLSDLESPQEPVAFEMEDEIETVSLKKVSSGRFTGLMLSLVAGAMTLAGLIYMVMQKLALNLNIETVSKNENMTHIANWFSKLVGMGDNPTAGMVVVGVVVLLVMLIVYLIRVQLKAEKNLRFATKQMEQTQAYITQREDCKAQMDRVDAHIHDSVALLKDYEVLLSEQNAKLKRILHFEGDHTNEHGYHLSSKEQMQKTQALIEQVEVFISVPMSNEGKLSTQSLEALDQTQKSVESFLAKLS